MLGVPGEPKPYMSGEPFHRCTHTALSPRGNLYVSDGYGNARIHKYTPDGKLFMSWGKRAPTPPVSTLPHNICCDPDRWLYVADRENHLCRYSTETASSELSGTTCTGRTGCAWRPAATRSSISGRGGPSGEINRDWPNIGPRVSIHTSKGKVLARLGKMHAGLAPRPVHLAARHGRRWARQHLCRRALGPQLGEVSKDPVPKRLRVIHKLVETAA